MTILHTIGGDDTNTQAAKVAEFLESHNYPVTVVGGAEINHWVWCT